MKKEHKNNGALLGMFAQKNTSEENKGKNESNNASFWSVAAFMKTRLF